MNGCNLPEAYPNGEKLLGFDCCCIRDKVPVSTNQKKDWCRTLCRLVAKKNPRIVSPWLRGFKRQNKLKSFTVIAHRTANI